MNLVPHMAENTSSLSFLALRQIPRVLALVNEQKALWREGARSLAQLKFDHLVAGGVPLLLLSFEDDLTDQVFSGGTLAAFVIDDFS